MGAIEAVTPVIVEATLEYHPVYAGILTDAVIRSLDRIRWGV